MARVSCGHLYRVRRRHAEPKRALPTQLTEQTLLCADKIARLSTKSLVDERPIPVFFHLQAVGGKAIFPVFAPGENSYPSELPPVTPQAYREHKEAFNKLVVSNMNKQIGSAEVVSDQEAQRLQGSLLSNEQLKALETMKRHTDFNDLAQKSILGREGVERQVGAAISQVKLKADEKHELARSNRNSEKQEVKREQRRGLKVV